MPTSASEIALPTGEKGLFARNPKTTRNVLAIIFVAVISIVIFLILKEGNDRYFLSGFWTASDNFAESWEIDKFILKLTPKGTGINGGSRGFYYMVVTDDGGNFIVNSTGDYKTSLGNKEITFIPSEPELMPEETFPHVTKMLIDRSVPSMVLYTEEDSIEGKGSEKVIHAELLKNTTMNNIPEDLKSDDVVE